MIAATTSATDFMACESSANSCYKRRVALIPPRINDVETGRTPQYPDVQPLHVGLPPERVFTVVSEVAGRHKRRTVGKVDPHARVLTAEARTALWRFCDDV